MTPILAAISLHSPWALALVALVPPALWIAGRRRRAAAHPLLPTVAQMPRLARSARQRLMWTPPVLRAAALVLLAVAIARPREGLGHVQTSTDAVAVQVVIDRSGSMRYEMEIDGQLKSRLEVVKRVLKDFLTGNGRDLPGRASDLIGLVTFAKFAETACPLVRDPKAVSDLAQALEPAMQNIEDGTAIGDGLSLAAARLHTAEQEMKSRFDASDPDQVRINSKIIILLTDGEQNAGEKLPDEAAAIAKDWGIRVYTIGIGAGAYAYETVRDPFFGERRVRVPSTVNEESLRSIADTTGGKYFRAQDGEALRAIYREIDQLEKTTVRTVEYTAYAEEFRPWALGAASLVLLEGVLSGLWLRRTA